ncbi:MAG: PIG-L family deacetylase [Deltaproteobacteria bacterium]|nr:PIG-L family deacetylase [Deltaproteobacteria bacterium]
MFPHPDDETYSAAGLLAWCAARGAAVHLASATRGERGWDRHKRIASGAHLAAHRSGELAAACAALGVAPPVCFDLPDGGVSDIDRAAAAAGVGTHLRALRPDLIVTLGRDGAYGHRDHLAWTAIVEAAVALLPDAERPRLLHAAFPRGLFTRVAQLGKRVGAVADDFDADGVGVAREAVALRLDVRPLRDAKLASCLAHDSQLDVAPGSFFRRVLEPLLEEEWFVVAAGPPLPAATSDPFAGL